MSDTPVVWLGFDGEQVTGKWDQTWLNDLLPQGEVRENGWPDASGDAVVVVTGGVDADQLATVLDRLDRVVLVVASNEERLFPWRRFAAPNRVLWLHTPDPDMGAYPPFGEHGYAAIRYLPTGWTPGVVERFADSCPTKMWAWSFVGQITHERRSALAARLATITLSEHGPPGIMLGSDRFFGDVAPDVYADIMRESRYVPCPAGNVSLDTFRVYEALQAGAVPVLDSRTSQGTMDDRFWRLLFDQYIGRIGQCPLWALDEWANFDPRPDGWAFDVVNVGAWWSRYKAEWRRALRSDLRAFAAPSGSTLCDDITVLITASPIPSHPDTWVLDETIRSIRESGLTSEIVIVFDGIRAEQVHREADYLEHQRRVVWAANNRWDNVSVISFEEHVHQANTAREALAMMLTPLVLFVEHDTPLCGEIDWAAAAAAVRSGGIDMLRFHYDDTIHQDHLYLTEDNARPTDVAGCPVIRTRQWSQRPHLANTSWYRRIITANFRPEARTMIEDRMHGIVANSPWDEYRLGVYAPPGGYRRSGHTDGRGRDTKFEMEFGDQP